MVKKMKKKGFMAGGMPMAGGAPAPAPAPAMGGGGGKAAKIAELKKRAAAGDPQAKAELAKMMAAQGGGAPAPAMPPKMPGMKGGGMAKKGYANGGVAKKNGKKATKSKGKVRGAGIAKKGVRKCKMR